VSAALGVTTHASTPAPGSTRSCQAPFCYVDRYYPKRDVAVEVPLE
jgi:hypothetical protein